jgi:hypothetical protein
MLEPKRVLKYGRYHKKLPGEVDPDYTPPWWPSDVVYEEPSPMDKTGMSRILLWVASWRLTRIGRADHASDRTPAHPSEHRRAQAGASYKLGRNTIPGRRLRRSRYAPGLVLGFEGYFFQRDNAGASIGATITEPLRRAKVVW